MFFADRFEVAPESLITRLKPRQLELSLRSLKWEFSNLRLTGGFGAAGGPDRFHGDSGSAACIPMDVIDSVVADVLLSTFRK